MKNEKKAIINGEVFKRKRRMIGLSQQKAAEDNKLSRSQYLNIENGISNGTVETLVKLMKYYSIEANEVFNQVKN